MGCAVAESEQAYLLECWDANVCPYCRSQIPAGARVGSGSKRKGSFCGLDCYAAYYAMELQARLEHMKHEKADD